MRMGADVPKQFLPLGGVPMLLHSLRAFDRAPSVDAVILVVPHEEQQRALTQAIERAYRGKVDRLREARDRRLSAILRALEQARSDS